MKLKKLQCTQHSLITKLNITNLMLVCNVYCTYIVYFILWIYFFMKIKVVNRTYPMYLILAYNEVLLIGQRARALAYARRIPMSSQQASLPRPNQRPSYNNKELFHSHRHALYTLFNFNYKYCSRSTSTHDRKFIILYMNFVLSPCT